MYEGVGFTVNTMEPFYFRVFDKVKVFINRRQVRVAKYWRSSSTDLVVDCGYTGHCGISGRAFFRSVRTAVSISDIRNFERGP